LFFSGEIIILFANNCWHCWLCGNGCNIWE
jgi:hypothetical protein